MPEALIGPNFPSANQVQRADEHRILNATIAILRQGEDLLRTISAPDYVRRVPLVFNASIGGHFRHCLDHFSSLLRALDTNEVNYDHRARDPRIESEPEFALAVTESIRARLQDFPAEILNATITTRCEVSYALGDSPVTDSTFGRELVYTIAHAIHHFALISVMARLQNVHLPEHFGVAPSTVAHEKSSKR